MPPPFFSVRHGAAVIHVASERDLEVVLHMVRASWTSAASIGYVAELSLRMLDIGSRVCPQARLESHFFKDTLDGPDSKFVGLLNAACSFARHVTEGEGIARVSTIIGNFEDLGGQGAHNAEGQVVDHWTEEVEKKRQGCNQAEGAYWQAPGRSKEGQEGRSLRTGLVGAEPSSRRDGQQADLRVSEIATQLQEQRTQDISIRLVYHGSRSACRRTMHAGQEVGRLAHQ